ncbi:MAG: hypothetical protein ABIA47_02725 [bacterium]
MPTGTTIGDLIISLFYDEFFALYEDEDLASVAAAAVINGLIAGAEAPEEQAAA